MGVPGRRLQAPDPVLARRVHSGAFTKALLDALTDPAADPDRRGLISASGLAQYVATRVSSLTGGAQTPGVETRFDDTVFAAGLWNEAGGAH